MSFIADKQTLEDLNLLGKYKQTSIFTLFNKTSTAGGERLLSELFQNPLTDPQAINRRSAIFSYFQGKQLSFPFSNKQFSAMEDYLSTQNGNSYLAVFSSLAKKKITALALHDEQFQHTQNGLQHTITVLTSCKSFINRLETGDHPFSEELLAAQNILNDKRLEAITAEGDAVNWSLSKIVKYDHLLKHVMHDALQKLLSIFYQLDVYISVANLAQAKGFGYAKALPAKDNVFTAAQLKHPGIENAVANPVSFHQNSNMIFLTGANMAGKSTFMKAFGINIYLAHMGFPVAAKSLEFSVKDGIYTSINVPDDLNKGYSHFYAEVLRVKTVAEQVSSGKNLVVIFDELFKGTNVKDAYDATLAVSRAFSQYQNCFYIISTHIIEAGEALRTANPGIQFLYMPTVLKGTATFYPYILEEGISADRHGMMIIRQEQILELLGE